MDKVSFWWERLRASYWFIPSVMLVGAIVLAFVMVWVDRRFETDVTDALSWFYGGGPDGARGLLSTVASSMITVAGVVFSITIVALSLASAQFGPRLLRNFMTDFANQVVLGTFVAAFIYCLLVLRTIRAGDAEFVPEISVTLGVVFAVAGSIVFVYFIHHVASSVQVEVAIGNVGQQLRRSMNRLYGNDEDRPGEGYERQLRQEGDLPDDYPQGACPVVSQSSGYVQRVQNDRLLSLATDRDVLIRLDTRLGVFVPMGAEIAHVWPGDRLDEDLEDEIRDRVQIGPERLHREDVEFYITQLVEIAIRALSPSMNDAFTAMSCIDQLGGTLSEFARRQRPAAYEYDEDGDVRLILQKITFPSVLELSFDMIRRNSGNQVAVMVRLLELLAVLGSLVENEEDRQAIYTEAALVRSLAEEKQAGSSDLTLIRARYQDVLRALGIEEPARV